MTTKKRKVKRSKSLTSSAKLPPATMWIDAQLIERHRNKTLLTLEMSHYPNFKSTQLTLDKVRNSQMFSSVTCKIQNAFGSGQKTTDPLLDITK